MRKVWFLYPDTTPRDSNAFSWFEESFSRYGMSVEVLFWDNMEVLPGLDEMELPEVAIMRGYNLSLSAYLESKGVMVSNSTRSMELSRDKIATAEILKQGGIPTPETYLYSEEYPSWERLQSDFLNEPIVMKLSFGSKGEDVFLLECEDDYVLGKNHCRRLSLERVGSRPLFQKFIAPSRGRDLRVWVIGDRVVGHLLRSNDKSFKSNFAQGGNAIAMALPERAAELAVAAAEVLGLDFAGVDILFGGDGFPEYLVCEVNGNAGFRTSSLVGGIDIPSALAEYIVSKF